MNTVTLNVSPNLFATLTAQADAKGVSLERFILSCLTDTMEANAVKSTTHTFILNDFGQGVMVTLPWHTIEQAKDMLAKDPPNVIPTIRFLRDHCEGVREAKAVVDCLRGHLKDYG